MRLDASAEIVAGEFYASVQGTMPAPSEADALRHSAALKAVLLAAKAWARRKPSAADRLALACERLAKIEKEVSRG